MREHKFRGKHKEQWLFGDLRQDSDGTCYIFPTEAPNSPDNYTVDPDTVGEFTGLYLTSPDKKEKEIYECDILKCGTFNGVITWHPNGYWCVHTREDEVEKYSYTPLGSMIEHLKIECLCCEVIGNIYDNPELMKGENQ